MTSPTASAPQAPTTPKPISSAAPRAAAATSGPTSGDVFLDGARLGTWLASHLSREASRPPAGTTGFDPRLGIAWPGTQQ
jgi:hypothetical protein